MQKGSRIGIFVVIALFMMSTMVNVSHADLIVHLEFEGNFDDSSGNGIHGTTEGDTAIVSDPVRGNVASFDGDDDIISLDPADFVSNGFDLLEEITIAMWVNTNQDISSTAFSGGFNTDWAAGGVHVKMNNGHVNVGINGGSGDVNGTTTIPVGEWHHIAFTATLLDFIVAVFYDGVEEGIQAPTNIPDFYDMALNPVIGAWRDGSGEIVREWSGLKDDVRIYNNALSPEEMTELFETTASVSSFVDDWSLHE